MRIFVWNHSIGNRFIGCQRQHQRPGFFFWIPPNVTYFSWVEKVRALRYLEVQFDVEQLERILGEDLDLERGSVAQAIRATITESLRARICLRTRASQVPKIPSMERAL